MRERVSVRMGNSMEVRRGHTLHTTLHFTIPHYTIPRHTTPHCTHLCGEHGHEAIHAAAEALLALLADTLDFVEPVVQCGGVVVRCCVV
jgi:hypothetical protein